MHSRARGGPRGKGRSAWVGPVLVPFLIMMMVLPSLPAATTAQEVPAHTSGRIIVISNETAIPIALGTPTTGMEPFEGVLVNKVGTYLTGQVVDGNYTPIWQPGSTSNNAIGDVLVQWSFNDEPDRAHTEMTDSEGRFSFFLTPDVQAPGMTELRFWFDGKTDNVYGIPIYPPAKITYDVSIATEVRLTVTPLQARAMAGDTILVQGRMTEPDGTPVTGEGLMAFVDGLPAQENEFPGWYIDDLSLGPLQEDFEDGMTGFETGGKGSSWSSGVAMTGPKGGHSSLRCAGTALEDNYVFDTDTWLMTPTVDLFGQGPAVLSFSSWASTDPEDSMTVELSNDDGLTWPVVLPVTPKTSWEKVTIPIGKFHDTPYGTVDLTGAEEVRVRFRLTSNVLPLSTGPDGGFEFEFKVPQDRDAGPAVVRVEHPASERFAKISSTTTFNVARMTALEAILPGSMFRGRPVEVRARLLDDDGRSLTLQFPGTSVPTPKVQFWLNKGTTETMLGERPVDPSGYAAIGYEPSRTGHLGPASFRLVFKGNMFYSPAETSGDSIVKAHTEVEILTPTDASLLAEDSILISGTVSIVRTESINDVTKDPVSKRDVQILLNGEVAGVATTDGSGTFSLEYDAKASGVNLGNAAITVRFDGDLVYEPSEDTVDFSILSSTTIQVSKRTIKKGSTVTIDGTLTSMQGGVQGIVEIEVGNELYKKVVTGASGRFATQYKVPWDMDYRLLPIRMNYRGNDVFKPSTAETYFTVEADTIILVNQTPIQADRLSTLELWGHVMETWDGMIGEPVRGELVKLRFPDGSSDQIYTGMTGSFRYFYSLPHEVTVGPHEVTVTFEGQYLSPSHASIPFEVSTSTQILLHVRPSGGDYRFLKGHTLTIDAHLLASGESDEGQPVSIYLQDGDEEVLLQKVTTDAYGHVVLKTRLNVTGPVTVVARFDGTQYHAPSESFEHIVLMEPPPEDRPLYQQPTVVLGGGLSIVVVLAVLLTESGKYVVFKLLLVPMYTKLKKTDVLDHFVRGQIYGLIRVQPGAHYNLIKKRLDLKNGVLSYHLATLEREGYIISEIDGIYKRFFPNHVRFEVDYPVFLTKIQERILDFIRVSPGTTQKEVAKGLGVSTSTVNDNVKTLQQNKLLVLRRDGKRTKCYVAED